MFFKCFNVSAKECKKNETTNFHHKKKNKKPKIKGNYLKHNQKQTEKILSFFSFPPMYGLLAGRFTGLEPKKESKLKRIKRIQKQDDRTATKRNETRTKPGKQQRDETKDGSKVVPSCVCVREMERSKGSTRKDGKEKVGAVPFLPFPFPSLRSFGPFLCSVLSLFTFGAVWSSFPFLWSFPFPVLILSFGAAKGADLYNLCITFV